MSRAGTKVIVITDRCFALVLNTITNTLIFLTMFGINFSKMLGVLVEVTPREMKYSEMCYAKRYRAVSSFLVNSFCSYG